MIGLVLLMGKGLRACFHSLFLPPEKTERWLSVNLEEGLHQEPDLAFAP